MSDEERVWVPDRSWRVLAPDVTRMCRAARGRCGRRAVAELMRFDSRSPGHRWWAYCADHLYGGRIDGDRVLVPVHPASRSAERGYVE